MFGSSGKRLGVLAVTGLLLVGACGDDEASPSTSTTGEPAEAPQAFTGALVAGRLLAAGADGPIDTGEPTVGGELLLDPAAPTRDGAAGERVEVNDDISFVPAVGWNRTGGGDNWQTWQSPDRPALAIITAEALDGRAKAEDLLQAETEYLTQGTEQFQPGDIVEIDPSRLGPDVVDAKGYSFTGVGRYTSGETYPIEGQVIAWVYEGNQIVIFDSVSPQGNFADDAGTYGAMIGSVQVGAGGGSDSQPDPPGTDTTVPDGTGGTTAPPTTAGTPTTGATPPTTVAQSDTDVQWEAYLMGVWQADVPEGGQELWTFNTSSEKATWQYWPNGYDPLSLSGGGPVSGGDWRIAGGTLTVRAPNETRTYTGIRLVEDGCFAGDRNGGTVKWCWATFGRGAKYRP